MNKMEDGKLIQHAINELKEAREQYDKAYKESQEASSQENQALNRLNQAQKDFDKAVDKIRTESPSSGDWQQNCKRF